MKLTLSKNKQTMDEARQLLGGWITFPFIIATMACLTLASGGWVSNLIVYLIQDFNLSPITAAKIYNFVNGSITMFPIVGAIIADSFLGCFSVICFSSLVSTFGISILVLTSALDPLRPPSSLDRPSRTQFAILYLALALSSLGSAGTRFTIAPMGADQFDSPKHRDIFFNWYIFTMYSATIVASTGIVYVQDNVSWVWGFGICVGANTIGLIVFLSGARFYRPISPKGSPFTALARVISGSISNRKTVLPDETEPKPTRFFRFLNRATLGGSTVREVEDLKRLIKIFPLWSTGLFLCTPLAIQLSMTILQALTMDRRLGGSSGFKVPAGSMPVFILVSTSVFIFVIDRLVFPLWEKITARPLTLLQRVGIGHALTVVSMGVSALVETRRRRSVGGPAAMSAMWLVPQLAVAGLGEAFHFPGQVAFYYREFPEDLKSTSTAAVAMFIGMAFYVSNGVIDLVRGVTGWLPDELNDGRLDNVYWVCCAVGGLNFGYYVVCASMYKYRDEAVEELEEGVVCSKS